MSAPATVISGLGVSITWTAPTAGGLPIAHYKVFIKATNDTFVLESANCNVATTTCQIPLLTLQASPFSLVLGDLVQVRIRAVNLVGESLDSSQNTGGALIETVPSAPPVAPLRNPLTTMSALVVDYYDLTGAAIGGTPVLSLELQWNQGDANATWTALVGGTLDSLQTQFTVQDSVNPYLVQSGQYYSFRYRAKNRQGWGSFSSSTSIISANVPDQLSPIVTSMNGANVKFAWSITDQVGYSSGGQPITEYDLLLLHFDNTTLSNEATHCAATA